ncbi:hypothetical protein FOJ82_09605 [Tessaracoccus rhinocerotis]|uniref:Uncharacterized protein n=1 Tax=Tessaracoccus rhinocerotis TaxID=1689449 RepID=A0A553K0P7_9ACTN|nr:hypothetical protein [Tessaracoccus rhinocerotis]TRY18280.1 hypothetical protein FOJ82_09605 [Tessaracoccus rhinocerotis]
MTEPERPQKPTTIVPLLAALGVFLLGVLAVVLLNLGGDADEVIPLPPLPASVDGGWSLTTEPDATAGTYEGPDGEPVVQVAWEETSVKEQIEGREFEASGEWACLPRPADDEPVCWADYRGGAVSVARGELSIPATVRFGDQFLFAWK